MLRAEKRFYSRSRSVFFIVQLIAVIIVNIMMATNSIIVSMIIFLDATLYTAVLKGKGAQWQEIARFARLYATYFYFDPLVL